MARTGPVDKHVTNAAIRNLANRVAVERSVRIVGAAIAAGQVTVDDVMAWAERIAAALPQFNAEEAARAGAVATALDARRAGDQHEAAS